MNIPTSQNPTRLPALCVGAGLFLAAALPGFASTVVYNQGFEADTSGWIDDSSSAGFGGIARVASGTGGIASQSGDFHAELTDIDSTGPYTNLGGFTSVWAGGYVSEIGVYIDAARLGSNGGFDYAFAMNNQAGTHLRDFAFQVTNDADTGSVLLNVGFGSAGFPNTDLENEAGTATLSAAGWYTLRSTAYDNGGILFVQMDVLDSSDQTVFSTTMSGGDVIATDVGGNRYAWFAALEGTDPLAVDNASLTVIPEPAAASLLALGLASMGLRRRRARA